MAPFKQQKKIEVLAGKHIESFSMFPLTLPYLLRSTLHGLCRHSPLFALGSYVHKKINNHLLHREFYVYLYVGNSQDIYSFILFLDEIQPPRLRRASSTCAIVKLCVP